MENHGLTITINTEHVLSNYALFQDMCPDAEVAAVVKADAYGCGNGLIVPVLKQAQCRTFFVAHLREAIELRKHVSAGEIYVLNGLMPETEAAYYNFCLKPVVTSQKQLFNWINFCRREKWNGGAALHIDTGINRLGFKLDEISKLGDLSPKDLGLFDLVLSHFACADELENHRNSLQIEAFTWARRFLSAVPRASLASSAGCFLGKQAHFDMVRPGIGLFGGNPFATRASPFKPVSAAFAPLLQVKLHRAGEFVGYGSGWQLQADTLVGVISVGYADGLPRRATAKPLNFYFGRTAIPALGRVSMDMTLVDLTAIAGMKPGNGDMVEIFGENRCVNAFAAALDTIPNEVMTAFARRAKYRTAAQILDVAPYASLHRPVFQQAQSFLTN